MTSIIVISTLIYGIILFSIRNMLINELNFHNYETDNSKVLERLINYQEAEGMHRAAAFFPVINIYYAIKLISLYKNKRKYIFGDLIKSEIAVAKEVVPLKINNVENLVNNILDDLENRITTKEDLEFIKKILITLKENYPTYEDSLRIEKLEEKYEEKIKKLQK